MILQIISKLSTVASTPEDQLVKQGDRSFDGMYFILIGDCSVNILDENRELKVAHKLLVEGDHFGEIG